ncbi:MAG: DUF1549 domain-containing protein, partial [Planctomycetaceae bacterium]|nr:DUF1549 domain-containing protein [Planctomycetaceae bacterium]
MRSLTPDKISAATMFRSELAILAFVVTWPVASSAADTVDFVRDVRPIFEKHCYDCHGASRQKSGYRLDVKSVAFEGGDAYAPNILPGKSAESPLLRFVSDPNADLKMPPEGPRLTAAEIGILQRWIDAGAEWPASADTVVLQDKRRHWSFLPVRRPALPETRDALWPRTDIDRFILARLEAEGLRPAVEVEPRVWLRRVCLTLTGLPPSPEQLDAFLPDSGADARERVVEMLLQSPAYGERWAQHWLDVVRYADTHGFEVNTPRDHAWRYRDYVIAAFNDDKPYDRFLTEQLVGDVLEVDAATGFLVASAVLLPGQIGQDDASKRLARQDALDEIVVGTSGAMLALTIGCARCHDHKFDPISQRDYYALQAFFAGVEYGDRPILDAEYHRRQEQARLLTPRIEEIERQLRSCEPPAFTGRTLIIDEQDAEFVTPLKTSNGAGKNPDGSERGHRDDPGADDRVGNLSRGQYTWWDNVAGQDVLAYRPGVEGRFRLWISWGAHGSGVHTRDARYVLDRDGDLATRDDQHELARVDQYYPAGISQGETEKTPLWSGLLDLGPIDWTPGTVLLVRGGDTGTGVTADVIVLQEPSAETAAAQPVLPRFRVPVNPRRNEERFPAVAAKFVRFTTLATIDDDVHEPCLDELEVFATGDLEANIALAKLGTRASSSGDFPDDEAHQLSHINDGQYGNERSWISNQQGGGWVQLELPQTTEIERVVWGRDRNGELEDRLPTEYHIDVSIDGVNWQTVAASNDRLPMGTPHDPLRMLLQDQTQESRDDLRILIDELTPLREKKASLEKPHLVYAGKFREPDETFLLKRGDPEQPGDLIAPAVPAFLRSEPLPAEMTESERRAALARWITAPNHPLTARVMVNRIWQHHFGIGLVETPNDFGWNGAAPSHPELLDWLASEFVRSGWSIKHLQRLIVLSAVYRQSAQIDTAAAERDRDNRLLWRYPSRRLEAEAIRDAMLFLTGELNLQLGGPGFS